MPVGEKTHSVEQLLVRSPLAAKRRRVVAVGDRREPTERHPRNFHALTGRDNVIEGELASGPGQSGPGQLTSLFAPGMIETSEGRLALAMGGET